MYERNFQTLTTQKEEAREEEICLTLPYALFFPFPFPLRFLPDDVVASGKTGAALTMFSLLFA
jgi:hypothetical protein